MNFRLMYPDVLGAIAGDNRILTDDLQFAVGIFPKQVFINQPAEIVIVLQNMVDQNMQVKAGLQLPQTDKNGNPVLFDTPKPMMAISLKPGEVGVLRMPITPVAPTLPGNGYPVRVAVRYRTQGSASPVRPASGGPPPSRLDVSPFRLQVLRDVDFVSVMWNNSADIITVNFDVAPKRLPPAPDGPKPRYEALWTDELMTKERELVSARLEDARRLATRLTHGSSYKELMTAVTERFANRGMPLHPGEARAIAKMMTYTVDEAPTLEKATKLEGMRWFRELAQVLAHDENLMDMRRGELLAKFVFDAIVFDTIGFAFKIVQPKIKEDLGSVEERVNYANRVMLWLAGSGAPDLNYVYLPLVLGGLLVNRMVMHDRSESPWLLIEELHEAYQGRMRLSVSGETMVIFHELENLLHEAETLLLNQRVPRG